MLRDEHHLSYFAVIIQVLQPSDSYISYVTSTKQDFTCGKIQWCLLCIQLQQMTYLKNEIPPHTPHSIHDRTNSKCMDIFRFL